MYACMSGALSSVFAYVCVWKCVRVCVHMNMYVYVCIYVCIYIQYIYTTYIVVYISSSSHPPLFSMKKGTSGHENLTFSSTFSTFSSLCILQIKFHQVFGGVKVLYVQGILYIYNACACVYFHVRFRRRERERERKAFKSVLNKY